MSDDLISDFQNGAEAIAKVINGYGQENAAARLRAIIKMADGLRSEQTGSDEPESAKRPTWTPGMYNLEDHQEVCAELTYEELKDHLHDAFARLERNDTWSLAVINEFIVRLQQELEEAYDDKRDEAWEEALLQQARIERQRRELAETQLAEARRNARPEHKVDAYTDIYVYGRQRMPCKVVGPLGFDEVQVEWPEGVRTYVRRSDVRNADGDRI